MATNALRMSGLNSGLDTEAIVNALTAATKNKINKNQRSILQLQAQQEAYRDIINKFNAFKDKYFDILNLGTCLKSKTMFNSFKSTLTSSTGSDYVPGVTVTSSSNANAGTYNVKVNKVATQSTYKSSNDTGKAVDFSDCTDNTQEYTMKVTVGSKSTYVTFHGNTDEAMIREEINQQLAGVFGKKNDGTNLVSIGADNKFVSSDKSSVVSTQPTLYTNKREADLTGIKTGNNSFTITVGETTKTVSFSTLEEDYFDQLFDETGKLKSEDELDDEGKTRLALFKQVVLNQRDGEVYEKYDEWWKELSDDDKKAFAEKVAKDKYQKAEADIQKDYDDAVKAKMQLNAYDEYKAGLEEGEEAMSFSDFVDTLGPFSAEDIEAFEATEDGQKLIEQRDEARKKLNDLYGGYIEDVVKKETDAVYKEQFELAKAEAKQAAYDEAVANGEISDQEGDENYVSLEDFEFTYTKEDFEPQEDGGVINEHYAAYQAKKAEIEEYYSDPERFTVDLDRMSDSQRMALYDEYFSAEEKGVLDEDDYINSFSGEEGFTAAREAVYQFNKANIENNLNSLYFGASKIKAEYGRDGKLTIEAESLLGEDIEYNPKFAITANANSTNNFGFDKTDVSGTASQVSTSSKLSELGLEPDANGNYSFTINGVKFSFSGDTTVSDMMKKVTASEAGVTMTYTTLTNQFILTAKEYGTGVDITFGDDAQGLLNALGFNEGAVFTEGQNTSLTINGVDVETTSNSYTVDGTTFTFTQAAEGQEFTNEVGRDYSKAIDTIKQFVEDYNKLIDDIYGYVDDEPNKDYYFLTDDDIDEMGLSESQQNKWEKMAKKGLLYRDNTLTDIMSKLRSVLYNSVDAADGSKVGLFTLGITTSSDYSNHGKLVFDETKDFEALFTQYADEITELFTNSEKGIATQFERIIDNATRTTGGPGERGSLVDKAGVSGTASATSNTIYNKIKSLQDMIATLQKRYEQQQDRYWKIYGNMESMLGNLNSQTSYINQLLGNY